MPLKLLNAPLLALLLSLPAIALASNTVQDIQRTRALAKPVLTRGAPDNVLLAHLRSVHEQQPTSDVMALVLTVMQEAYKEQTEELKEMAEKLKHYNEMKKALREYMRELNSASDELNHRDRATLDSSSSLNRMDNALRNFEAALRRSRELKPGDQRDLNAIVARHRRFISASRRLLTQARAISHSPRRVTPRLPTPTKQPTLRRPQPPNGNLRVPPR